jgi:hypothetical protein
MDWIKDPQYTNTYYTTKKFNGYQYNVLIITEETDKSFKYWVHVSSGKKRKEFEIFEDKENKSLGGIRSLFWIKEAMFDFYNYITKRRNLYNKAVYICVGWADNRRRNIYQRLEKEGFQFSMENGKKILIKRLK